LREEKLMKVSINEREVKEFVKDRVITFDQCFRCGACSGICPVKKTSLVFDPRKIVHLFLNGMLSEVLNELLWYCSQCGSCVPVCPMDVKPKEVIKALRDYVLDRGLVDEEKLFELGVFARVNPSKCILCLTCVRTCPFQAISIKEERYAFIEKSKCRACGICVRECPARAIELREKPEYLEVSF
jgi:heterodisulfide reductase subunit C